MKDHILIVDDDPEIRGLLAGYLSREGMQVTAVADGKEMRCALTKESFDLIVLDLMLPHEDGITLIRQLRERSESPVSILMLSARGDGIDRIIGLEVGADDYVTKPFVPRELLARIRAVLRRTRMLPPGMRSAGVAGRFVTFGDWRLDNIERCLINRDGTISKLSGADYGLLSFFLEQPGRVITRDQLMDRLVGVERACVDRSIDLRVSRLRRKLGDFRGSAAEYVKTIRNEGYVFAKAVEYLS